MNAAVIILRRSVFCLLLVTLSLPASAAVFLLWDYESEPTPFTLINESSQDIYAFVFPHSRASTAYNDNGWSSQVVSRTEWEDGSFSFTGAAGWNAPSPSSIDLEQAFPEAVAHGVQQVVAFWVASGTLSPVGPGDILDGFWTDVTPAGELNGIVLGVDGSWSEIGVSSVPLPLPAHLFLVSLLALPVLRKMPFPRR